LYPVDYSGGELDIGPKTSDIYSKILFGAKTIIWAGPAGAYDQGYFEGSRQMAKAIIASKAYSVVGGGDTIACLNQLKMLQDFDFVSTGGGAMIDFLAGKELPGLRALGYYK
jgi:phosphoglycerate kinase